MGGEDIAQRFETLQLHAGELPEAAFTDPATLHVWALCDKTILT